MTDDSLLSPTGRMKGAYHNQKAGHGVVVLRLAGGDVLWCGAWVISRIVTLRV